MPCFTPLKAYRGPGGQVVFSSRAGYLDRPLELPCGQCVGCRIAKSKEWALRCVHEAAVHPDSCVCGCLAGGPTRNCFITLTYSREFLPADGSVDVRHWQLFAKRVRKALGAFRFLHCGEYGDKSYRPHYHGCVFGQDFDRPNWRVFQQRNGISSYTSKCLTDLWGAGHCTVGELTWQSAAYVARYTLKKVNRQVEREEYRRIDVDTGEEFFVRPAYVTMSRRPGLGSAWYDRYKGDVFPSDEMIHAGKRHPVPDFYWRRLEAEEPEIHGYLKAVRAQRARDLGCGAAPLGGLPREATGEYSPSRLSTKEECLTSKLSVLRRDI